MAGKWLKSRAWYVAKILSLETKSERVKFLGQTVPVHLQADVRREVERQFALKQAQSGKSVENPTRSEVATHAGA